MWIIFESNGRTERMVNTDTGKRIARLGGTIYIHETLIWDGKSDEATEIFNLIREAITKNIHLLDLTQLNNPPQ